jgi:hypothetical protein
MPSESRRTLTATGGRSRDSRGPLGHPAGDHGREARQEDRSPRRHKQREPASTHTRLLPSFCNSASACCEPAVPMATTQTTAPMPTVIPRAVSELRSLLRQMARKPSTPSMTTAETEKCSGIREFKLERIVWGNGRSVTGRPPYSSTPWSVVRAAAGDRRPTRVPKLDRVTSEPLHAASRQ